MLCNFIVGSNPAVFYKAIGGYLDYMFGRKYYENVYNTVVLDKKYTTPYGKPSKFR